MLERRVGIGDYVLAQVFEALGVVDRTQVSAEKVVVGYSRVSSFDQKDDLERQTTRLSEHLRGEPSAILISDLGSGLNFQKRGLCKLIKLILAGRVQKLVITHKDRLLRFGFELIETLVTSHGGTIEILEDVRGTDDTELAKDVLTIITVFSAKLYGRRAHKNKKAA